jgi:serine/threonine protein kinase
MESTSSESSFSGKHGGIPAVSWQILALETDTALTMTPKLGTAGSSRATLLTPAVDESCSRASSDATLYCEPGEISPTEEPLVGLWRVGAPIGSGTFGTVLHAEHTLTGTRAVVKKMLRSSSDALTEAEALFALQGHPNIVHLHEVIEHGEFAYLVLEYVDGMELFEFIDSRGGKLDEGMARGIMIQLLSTLEFIHSQRYLHRDIKLDNIMIMKTGQIKLIDFNLATRFGPTTVFQECVGSLRYAAPPILELAVSGIPYSAERGWIDVYSAGVCLFGMLSGSWAFDSEDVHILFRQIVSSYKNEPDLEGQPHVSFGLKFPVDCKASRMALECCKLMLDCRFRFSAAEVLSHLWFEVPVVAPVPPPKDTIPREATIGKQLPPAQPQSVSPARTNPKPQIKTWFKKAILDTQKALETKWKDSGSPQSPRKSLVEDKDLWDVREDLMRLYVNE